MEHYSVQFLGPGWVELPPNEPARPIGLDDWRVLKAKEEGKKFLQGTAASSSVNDRDEIIRKLNLELEEEKKKHPSDPDEIEKLRKKIQDQAQENTDANAELKKRDDRISGLEKDLREAQNRPPPAVVQTASRFAQWRGFVQRHPFIGGGFTAVPALLLLLILLFAWYGFSQYRHPVAMQGAATVTGSNVPADYDSVKSDLADLKAKMAAKEAAQKTLADTLKNLRPLPELLPFDPDAQ